MAPCTVCLAMPSLTAAQARLPSALVSPGPHVPVAAVDPLRSDPALAPPAKKVCRPPAGATGRARPLAGRPARPGCERRPRQRLRRVAVLGDGAPARREIE